MSHPDARRTTKIQILERSAPVPAPSRRSGSPDTDYVDLKRLLTIKGVFRPQPLFYISQVAIHSAMYVAVIAILLLSTPLWLKLLDAVFAAFVFTQLGYIGHDLGHRQVFPGAPKRNDRLMLGMGPFMGLSRSWWVINHNEHHSFPNDLDRDPHTIIPGLAFSQEKAAVKTGFSRRLTRFQAFYFFPMLLLQGFGIRLASILTLTSGRGRYPVLEASGMALHFVLYGVLLFSVLAPVQALAFILIHQCLMGFYMGSVFAPNHKGMPIISKDEPVDFFRRQVLTTRNLKPGLVTDYICGGLGYQVEHHLFPTLPRNKLGEARRIVKAFCRDRSIAYYETGFWQSYVEVVRALGNAVEPLKGKA